MSKHKKNTLDFPLFSSARRKSQKKHIEHSYLSNPLLRHIRLNKLCRCKNKLYSDTRLVINMDVSDLNCTFAPMRLYRLD